MNNLLILPYCISILRIYLPFAAGGDILVIYDFSHWNGVLPGVAAAAAVGRKRGHPKMHILLERYKTLVEFLGAALGGDYEIVLHDLSEGNNSVVAIANGYISGRELGAPLTALGTRFLADKEYEQCDFKVGYRGVSKRNGQLQCGTMFIKNEKGKVIGMLCINYDPSRGIRAANEVLALCGVPPVNPAPAEANPSQGSELFATTIPDMVQEAIEQITGRAGLPSNRLTMDEKIRIVDSLQKSGLFHLKGAVGEVASQLNASEATIYRYLSKLRNS